MSDATQALAQLMETVSTLLGPNGCPWDKEQSTESLCDYIIEESFELVDAIRKKDTAAIRDEAGDLLFLLLLIAAKQQEAKHFSFADVLTSAQNKMTRRHPHVFGDMSFDTQEEQLAEWERIKRQEKKDTAAPEGVYASLPKGLPPLVKAYRIHSKAARVGFSWDNTDDVQQQVEAEWLELLDALQGTDQAAQEHELGDMIFTLVELGRRKGIKASGAVDATANRFLTRFAGMEALAKKQGLDFHALDVAEKETLWNTVKAHEIC